MLGRQNTVEFFRILTLEYLFFGKPRSFAKPMSAYKDFVADFPQRCREVLRLASREAQAHDREVTLLLLVASGSLVIPFERLRPGMNSKHPATDQINFPNAAARLNELLSENFLISSLWGREVGSWEYSHLLVKDGGPDAWDELRSPASIRNTLYVNQILAVIRNGLAHGNVYTTGDPIKSLIFVSERRKDRELLGHQYVRCSPADFAELLDHWFEFLQNNQISQADVARSLASAA